MSNPVLTAAILIEANGAALNNAGNDAGQRLDNAVVVKQIRVGRNAYPYISGQAVRRWWREVLYADFAWEPSPVTREAKSAYTEGNPIAYPDDDMFGYMAAKKAKKAARKPKRAEATAQQSVEVSEEDEEGAVTDAGAADDTAASGGTQRRISPLKNSLIVAVLPRTIATDFGHFSRDLPVDNPNMVPFEHEHYTALMQGVFTVSLQDVGRFECGLMRDIALDAAAPEGVTVQESSGNLKPRVLTLDLATRQKRVQETLLALGRLRYGANLTRNLSDVVPVVALLGFLDGGNAPFQNLFTPDADGERVILNLPRLASVVKDYKDRLQGGEKLFFGYRPGVLANEQDVLAALEAGVEGVSFFVGTPGEAIKEAAALIDKDGLLS